MAPDDDSLIERTNVPELEVLLMQQQLNARVRAGQLSGPILAENGRLDALTKAKAREAEAVDAIATATIAPRRPTGEAAEAARAADEDTLAFVRAELALIADTPYMDFDHKGPSLRRIEALEAKFAQKWAPPAVPPAAAHPAAAQIAQALAAPPRPGGLLTADGAFDYARLDEALRRQRAAEAALATVPPDEPARPGLADQVAAHRQAIVEGLKPGAAKPRPAAPAAATAAAPAPEPGTTAPLRPPSPSRPLPTLPTRTPTAPALVDPGFTPDPERDREGRQLDILGPEQRLQMLRDGGPDDPMAAKLAASIARTHPESFTAELAGRLDPYAMNELARHEAFAKVPPAARLALVKDYARREAEGAEFFAAAALAGAAAASLLQQHPGAAAELIAGAPGALKPQLTVAMLGRLDDDALKALPREALHALYKEIQARTGADERRHMARLVRLMNKR